MLLVARQKGFLPLWFSIAYPTESDDLRKHIVTSLKPSRISVGVLIWVILCCAKFCDRQEFSQFVVRYLINCEIDSLKPRRAFEHFYTISSFIDAVSQVEAFDIYAVPRSFSSSYPKPSILARLCHAPSILCSTKRILSLLEFERNLNDCV